MPAMEFIKVAIAEKPGTTGAFRNHITSGKSFYILPIQIPFGLRPLVICILQTGSEEYIKQRMADKHGNKYCTKMKIREPLTSPLILKIPQSCMLRCGIGKDVRGI